MISVAHAAAEGHAGSAGMPQFEPSVFQHQIIWSIISFLILLHLLRKHVLPAIKDLLDGRSKSIEDDLNNAKRARMDAEKALADLNKQVVSARQMATDTMEQARIEAVHTRERAMEELAAELSKKKSSALEEIEGAKNKALSEVQTVAVELSILATEKLIAKSITKTAANAMVEEALNEIKESKAFH